MKVYVFDLLHQVRISMTVARFGRFSMLMPMAMEIVQPLPRQNDATQDLVLFHKLLLRIQQLRLHSDKTCVVDHYHLVLLLLLLLIRHQNQNNVDHYRLLFLFLLLLVVVLVCLGKDLPLQPMHVASTSGSDSSDSDSSDSDSSDSDSSDSDSSDSENESGDNPLSDKSSDIGEEEEDGDDGDTEPTI